MGGVSLIPDAIMKFLDDEVRASRQSDGRRRWFYERCGSKTAPDSKGMAFRTK